MPVLYLWLPPHQWIQSQTDSDCFCTVLHYFSVLTWLRVSEWVCDCYELQCLICARALSFSFPVSLSPFLFLALAPSFARFSYTQFNILFFRIFVAGCFNFVNIVASLSLNNTLLNWCAQVNCFITVVYSRSARIPTNSLFAAFIFAFY